MKRLINSVIIMVLLNIPILAEDLNLPDLLKTEAGQKVTTAQKWKQQRRPEILEWFRANMFGRAPLERPPKIKFKLLESDKKALNGKATRKQECIDFTNNPKGLYMILLVYIPNGLSHPAPAFVGLNPRGNQVVHSDPKIMQGTKWSCGAKPKRIARGANAKSWPIEKILDRGYAVATAHCSDLDPDKNEGFKDGVQGYFDPIYWPEGRPKDAWGTIAAWAWGLSRTMDYFETDPDIDQNRIGVFGLSRRGKAALWCAAQDQRFALAVSYCSGGQGAALMRVEGGNNDIKKMVSYAPHWFCEKFHGYVGRDKEMPMDQHMLVALIAPRLVYVASASQDKYAAPIRDFLGCLHASPAWELFGFKGLTTDTLPEIGVPLHQGRIGYHIREGRHGLKESDWEFCLDFADKYDKMNLKK